MKGKKPPTMPTLAERAAGYGPATVQRATAAISKARAKLILDQPFFSVLALRLQVQPDMRVPTMATDGRYLLFDPAWVLAKSGPELMAVIAHEAMHVALHHNTRRRHREPPRWNQACDHAINPILAAAKFTLPAEGLSTVKPQYPGMSAEQIYPLLPEDDGGPGDGKPFDCGGMGCVLDALGADGKPLPEAERDQMEREWKIALLQAAQTAKAQGRMPGGLEDLIESVRAPQVDWRTVLREFVRSVASGDYSWRRPNVRHLGEGHYFPSLYDETVPPLAIGVDTSGSVSNEELAAICDELNGILDTVKPESVIVVYADAEVQHHETFTPDNYPVKMAVKGRGGTDLRGIWPFLAEQEIQPACAVVATDMELHVADLGQEPDFPVLFISTSKREQPMDGPVAFGSVVRIQS